MIRVEWLESDNPDDLTPMAEMRMNGDQCEVVWFSVMLKQMIEDSGVRAANGDKLRPADGQDFYNAVGPYFAHSSHIFVTNELDDSEWGQSQADGYEPIPEGPPSGGDEAPDAEGAEGAEGAEEEV